MNLKLILTAASGQAKMQLDNMMKDAGNTLAKGAADSLSRVFKGIGGAGGRAGGMLSAFPVGGAAGAAVAGVGAIVGILKMIHDGILKMVDKLGEASGAFKASREMLDKMFNFAMKPMADVMTALMRPYLMLIMRRIRAAMPEIRALMPAAMAGDDQAIKDITKLTQELMGDITAISHKMNKIILPIAGSLDGFKKGLDIIFNDFLTGTLDVFISAKKAITENFGPMPKTLSAWIEKETTANPSFFNALPKNIAKAYDEAAAGEEALKIMQGVSTKVSTKWGDVMISDTALADLTKLAPGFAAGLTNPLGTIIASAQTVATWFSNLVATITNIPSGYTKIPGKSEHIPLARYNELPEATRRDLIAAGVIVI
mgnify:CR=1 FL=1